MNKFFLIILGFISGIFCGLLGVGGGVILVLVLSKYKNLDQHHAQATAISVIFLASLSSFVSYFLNDSLNFSLIIPALLGSLIGGYFGAILLNKLSSTYLQLIFAIFMLIAGVKMLCI